MQFAEFRELQTERLILRRIRAEDAPQYYHRLFGSPAVARYMLWQPHTDISQSEAAVEKVLQRYEAGAYYRWGIALQEDDSLIGILELLRFEEESGKCSFAYMLGEEFWGKGLATKALRAAFAFAFDEMAVSVIEADHFLENGASGAVMRKAGMRCVEVLPRRYEKDGIWHDAVLYRITKEEWQKIHGAEN